MSNRTEWHQILGKQLELLLTPLNITVLTDLKVMSKPPRADILILSSEQAGWTAAQMACLPHGIRDVQVKHVLVEFKFGESLTEHHLRKIIGYQVFYQESQTLTDEQVQSFILSSKTPSADFQTRYGYQPTTQAGVWRSQNVMLKPFPLITLNDLADTPYNAYVKCFASRAVERQKAFAQLAKLQFEEVSRSLWFFLVGLRNKMNVESEAEEMEIRVTPEDIIKLGQEIGTEWILHLPPEERMQGLGPEERLRGLEPEVVLSQYKPMADYLTAREKALLVQGLRRSLQVRFDIDEARWEKYRQRFQQLDVPTLEKLLSETIILVEDEAAFERAVEELGVRS